MPAAEVKDHITVHLDDIVAADQYSEMERAEHLDQIIKDCHERIEKLGFNRINARVGADGILKEKS